MSMVHVPFYPSDWLAGTAALSDTEKGVYITLVARMYEMAGPIERDDNRLFRVCGSKSKASFVKALEYLISEGKILVTDEGLFNEKASKVIEQTTEKSSKAKAAAQSRWDRKSNKNKGGVNANASPKHMPQLCQPEPEPELDKELKRDTIVSPKKAPDQSFDLVPSEQIPKPAKNAKASRLPDDWALPRDWGDWAVSEGWDASDVRLEAEKFRDFWISKAGKDAAKLNWLATWRNWMRNSRTPKSTSINGGIYDQNTNKSDQRDRALADEILAAARAR
tara:strand:+ start:2450 stop:3283 length:834 start_codon:yes stop_codon:yes gene_type:complete